MCLCLHCILELHLILLPLQNLFSFFNQSNKNVFITVHLQLYLCKDHPFCAVTGTSDVYVYLCKRDMPCIVAYLCKRGMPCVVVYLCKRGMPCVVAYLHKRGMPCTVIATMWMYLWKNNMSCVCTVLSSNTIENERGEFESRIQSE